MAQETDHIWHKNWEDKFPNRYNKLGKLISIINEYGYTCSYYYIDDATCIRFVIDCGNLHHIILDISIAGFLHMKNNYSTWNKIRLYD